MFIVVEGNNGSGKTTMVNLLSKWLKDIKLDLITVKEPGGTPVGEEIRNILLNSENNIDITTQALLFSASRAQLVREIIIPALESSHYVICDRFTASTIIHQGILGDMDVSDIIILNNLATDYLKPDLTLYLQLDDDEVIKRIRERGETDNFDSKPDEYHINVNRAYDKFFHAFKEEYNVEVIDANVEVNKVFHQIQDAVMRNRK